MKKELPSGRKIFNPLQGETVDSAIANTAAVVPGVREQESTSAMSHDADNTCPKCQGSMLPARAAQAIPVVFCDKCRVAHPQRA
jgi:hypothetical protein